MPELQRLYPELRRAGVDLVGISVDLETVDQVAGYVQGANVAYPIYTTETSVMESLFPRGEVVVPVTVLLDAEGRVSEVYSGWSKRSEEALRRLVSD
jgi:peroxiredoxin